MNMDFFGFIQKLQPISIEGSIHKSDLKQAMRVYFDDISYQNFNILWDMYFQNFGGNLPNGQPLENIPEESVLDILDDFYYDYVKVPEKTQPQTSIFLF